jgi:8-oxo-dGTP pyrophosphatase MutT (NUDIX family)
MVNNTVKHTVGVGALIYSRATKRYLFLLRNGAKHGGEWGLVGGKVDLGETSIQALKREIQEEIGGFNYHKVIPLEHFTSDNGKFEYHTYIIPVKNEFIPSLNHEHRGYAWTHIEDHPRPLHPGVWRSFSFESILKKIRTVEHVL